MFLCEIVTIVLPLVLAVVRPIAPVLSMVRCVADLGNKINLVAVLLFLTSGVVYVYTHINDICTSPTLVLSPRSHFGTSRCIQAACVELGGSALVPCRRWIQSLDSGCQSMGTSSMKVRGNSSHRIHRSPHEQPSSTCPSRRRS
jgi:hypothetical protein